MSERSARNEKRSGEVECSVRPYLLPELSNFYCHPGRAGGSPWLLGIAPVAFICGAATSLIVRPHLGDHDGPTILARHTYFDQFCDEGRELDCRGAAGS